MIETIIDDILLANTNINNLTGGRVQPIIRHETTPSISYIKTDSSETNNIDGTSTAPKTADITFTAYAKTYGTVKQLADLIKVQFLNYKNTINGVKILYTNFVDDSDDYDPETKVYTSDVVITFHYV